jgi:hypothetical protein
MVFVTHWIPGCATAKPRKRHGGATKAGNSSVLLVALVFALAGACAGAGARNVLAGVGSGW